MDEQHRKDLAKALAGVAISSLAASLGGASVGAVMVAGGAAGATSLLDRLAAAWNRTDDFIACAETELPRYADTLGLDEAGVREAFHQAIEAMKAAGLSAAALAGLGFDPERAAACVAADCGHQRIQAEDAPARRLLVRLHELLLEDPKQVRRFGVAFQREALRLLGSSDARLRELAEAIGWAALLYLPAPPWRRQPTEAMLLDPAAGVVPYQPRAEDDELAAWLDGDADIALRLYEAEGGAGKTRFLLERCHRASAAGWRVGFLSADPAAREAAPRAWRTLFADAARTLVVVDYAETRADQLERLFAAAREAPATSQLRIVLLTRRVDGEWWRSLRARLSRDAADLLDEYPPEQRQLPPLLTDADARQALYASALPALREALTPRGASPVERDPALPDLRAPHYRLPLFVALAALDRLLGGSGAGDEQALLQRLLDHERRHWTRDGLEPLAVEQAVATVTLWQGANRGQLEALPGRWPRSAPLRHARVDRLWALLADLYADHDQRLQPLRPDRLGECLIEQLLRTDAVPLAEASLGPGVAAADLRNGFDVLTRLPLRAADDLKQLGEHLARVLKEREDWEFVARLLNRLPDRSFGLAEFAANMTFYVYQQLKKKKITDEEGKRLVAVVANNLAIRWRALGRRKQALEAAREAVVWYGNLVDQGSLAMSLNGFAICLYDLGQHKKALRVAVKAVTLSRDLVRPSPKAFFKQDFAMCLDSLANCMAVSGRYKEALDAAVESVDLYRSLCYPHQDDFVPGLAGSLNNLANHCSNLDRREEALSAAEEAVVLYRGLADQRPDAFTPYLAMSLNTLANRLYALDRREKALRAAKEAVALHRDLAGQRPDAFMPDLATSLGALGNILSEDQASRARDCFAEGIERLTPEFLRYPAGLAGLMAGLVGNYQATVERLGETLDVELLEPVDEAFARMRQAEDSAEG